MPDQIKERLRQLLEQTDEEFRTAFFRYVQDIRSDQVLGQIENALRTGDQQTALNIIRGHVERLGNVIPSMYQTAANATMGEIDLDLPATVAISFDPTNPRAARIMRRERLGFIRDFTRKQLIAVRSVLAEGLQAGDGIADVARRIGDVIGLTEHQVGQVENYRRLVLEDASEALTRDLRDRRFDRTLEGSIRRGEPITAAQADRMTDRYRERFIAHRAETIARTESTRITNQARSESFEQALEQTGIRRDRVVRVWNAVADTRTRDWHSSMDGQERGADEPFLDGRGNSLMYPGDPNAPAETVINCRCVLTARFRPPE